MRDDALPVDRAQIEELREQHIGRLFLRAQRDFSLRAIEKLRAAGHDGLSLVHTNLLAHLDTAGTRTTTLAERAGITKQAIGHLVAELEAKGYIKRAVDPADRRATLITYTAAGWQFLQDAHRVKRSIEAEYTAKLGERGMASLREMLTQLLSDSQGHQMGEEGDGQPVDGG
jgi:DNA-binding MarR family transcriptional regulator